MFGKEQLKMKHESVKEVQESLKIKREKNSHEVMTKRCKNYFISK